MSAVRAKILNFGSLNLDYVYRVAHIVRPGETISSSGFEKHCGGKGANQSVALARAGAWVFHAGKIGPEGDMLRENLEEAGVETVFTLKGETPTGHAIIQVSDDGENSIVLFGGANQDIEQAHVDRALAACGAGDILLLQNEINGIDVLIERAHDIGMLVCLNPAPFDESIKKLPLEKLSMLILNETEGAGLAGCEDADEILAQLCEKYPQTEIILTLGSAGVRRALGNERDGFAGFSVSAVDTTAAGDTFIGYYLAGKVSGLTPAENLKTSCAAAAITVTRSGAAESIPAKEEVAGFLAQHS